MCPPSLAVLAAHPAPAFRCGSQLGLTRRTVIVQPHLNLLRLLPIGVRGGNSNGSVLLVKIEPCSVLHRLTQVIYIFCDDVNVRKDSGLLCGVWRE